MIVIYKLVLDGKMKSFEDLSEAVHYAYASNAKSVLMMIHLDNEGTSTEEVIYTMIRKYEYMPEKVWEIYENYNKEYDCCMARSSLIKSMEELLAFCRLGEPEFYVLRTSTYKNIIGEDKTIFASDYLYKTKYLPDAFLEALTSKCDTVIVLPLVMYTYKQYLIADIEVSDSDIIVNRNRYDFFENVYEEECISTLIDTMKRVKYEASRRNNKDV